MAEDLIALANYSLPFLPIPLWQAALIIGAAVWVVSLVRAWRSGK